MKFLKPGPGFYANFIFCLLFFVFCAVYGPYLKNAPATDGSVSKAVFGPSSPLQAIPDGRGNYRSASLTAGELTAALQTGKIKYVLRLNGDSRNDRGHLTTDQERAIVEAHGAVYVTSPSTPDRFDAKAGYREGRGYVTALARATDYFRRGGVLIHCRHNHDRTGSLVGGWLANATDLPASLILAHNSWTPKYPSRSATHARNWETVTYALITPAK